MLHVIAEAALRELQDRAEPLNPKFDWCFWLSSAFKDSPMCMSVTKQPNKLSVTDDCKLYDSRSQ